MVFQVYKTTLEQNTKFELDGVLYNKYKSKLFSQELLLNKLNTDANDKVFSVVKLFIYYTVELPVSSSFVLVSFLLLSLYRMSIQRDSLQVCFQRTEFVLWSLHWPVNGRHDAVPS